MSDQLGEALALWDNGVLDAPISFNPIVAAARNWHARQTPDYEAAARITRELTSMLPVMFEGSHDPMVWTLNIVDAALTVTADEEAHPMNETDPKDEMHRP